jgi:hypothetical protein
MAVTRAGRKREHVESAAIRNAPTTSDGIDLIGSDVDRDAGAEQTQTKAKRQKKDVDPCPPCKREGQGRVLMPLNHDESTKNNTNATRAGPYGCTTHNRTNPVSKPSVARVVSENPSTKRAKVTRTITTTANHFTNNNKLHEVDSFRKTKGVPIKTPATHESMTSSGNDATSTHKPQRRSRDDGGNETAVASFLFKKGHGINSTIKSNDSRSKQYQHCVKVDDIDATDQDDPLSVTDYVRDIYDHYRKREEVTTVLTTQLATHQQPHITERMRAILVDWLLEVHYKFKLCQQTLYLAISVLDRFLSMSNEPVARRELQLVGITSLLVAAKYEELFVPELRDLAYICDGAYTELQVGTTLLLHVFRFMFCLIYPHIPNTDFGNRRQNFEGHSLQLDHSDGTLLPSEVSQGRSRQQRYGSSCRHDSRQYSDNV